MQQRVTVAFQRLLKIGHSSPIELSRAGPLDKLTEGAIWPLADLNILVLPSYHCCHRVLPRAGVELSKLLK